jgi:hypothetical protein
MVQSRFFNLEAIGSIDVMGNIRGCKKIGSHGTAIKAAVPVVRAAERSPLVTKIALGMIDAKTGSNRGPNRIKIEPVPAGLKLMVRGRSSVQEIWIYTAEVNRLETIKLIESAFHGQ